MEEKEWLRLRDRPAVYASETKKPPGPDSVLDDDPDESPAIEFLSNRPPPLGIHVPASPSFLHGEYIADQMA